MKKYSIESFEQLVHTILRPNAVMQATPEQITDWLATSIKLKESLSRQLLLDSLYSKTEEENEILVERHQIIVATLLNQLFNHQHHESITREHRHFYQKVAAQLEDIIAFLKNNFARFFNTDLHLPFPVRLREGNELKHQWKMIIKIMPDAESNIRLVNILERLIADLLKVKEEIPARYHQVSYLKNLIKEISAYFSTTTCRPVYASLTELLISWNFNEPIFIREVCTNIRTEMEKKESDECRLEFLKVCYKQVSQLLEINVIPFYSSLPSAQKTILDWISQELVHLEWTAATSETKKNNEEGKIQTSLSVHALALFTRLFKETGIYTDTNQTNILKSVSSHFTTTRQLEVSYGHLKSKYYQIDEGTKRKVIDHLMEMAQRCKKL
ncbi:MAG: hypothetical protein ACJ751_06805 [Niastella sp.]|uniref:hypothetical protein n=1 Tax=Niastella sp. TaxID=1869183 RepID=UPI00389AA442